MKGIGAFVGGVLLIAAIFAGWWAIDRVQEHLPGPVNAVIDSVQNGGLPGPLVQPLPDQGASDPLAACPEFAADARVAERAFRLVPVGRGDRPGVPTHGREPTARVGQTTRHPGGPRWNFRRASAHQFH